MKILLLCLVAMLSGCTDEPNTRRVLENDGFKNIQITGWRPFTCDEKDSFATGFIAEKNGRTVTGCVCSGIFKGHTIRFD